MAAPATSASASQAVRLVEFLNASPSPFHAVEECVSRLIASGFQRISEAEDWKLENNGKYFFTRNHSTILAFAVGGAFSPGSGFNLVGAHTDSPVLKVKPISKIPAKEDFLQVGVEPYGGGLWHTWFDRDLSVAGRVITKIENKLEERLVRVNRPILRIPSLAIHLDRSVKEGFKFNEQTHLLPIISSSIKGQLDIQNDRHHPVLLEVLANELKCDASSIKDFELCLYDTQLGVIGGAKNEWVFSPRLDNLVSSYCSLQALLSYSNSEALKREKRIAAIALFDNEEVGSESEHGAASSLIEHFLRRATRSFKQPAQPNDVEIAFRKTFLISADMAHACHPNYSEKHDGNHKPKINAGPVIKQNANQRYATTAVTATIIRELATRSGVPIQDFVVRNDSLCGSTIGPILSAYGIRTVDLGNPQFSMHSIREMCGTEDVEYTVKLLETFFTEGTQVDESLHID